MYNDNLYSVFNIDQSNNNNIPFFKFDLSLCVLFSTSVYVHLFIGLFKLQGSIIKMKRISDYWTSLLYTRKPVQPLIQEFLISERLRNKSLIKFM